tara:strand:- start:357 stop:533 length:177 start_codon:yes stop_codon:yes gene_type:complete
MRSITDFFNQNIKPTEVKNTYVPSTKAKIKIQSTVDEGKGLDFNQKANHIFGLIKQMK